MSPLTATMSLARARQLGTSLNQQIKPYAHVFKIQPHRLEPGFMSNLKVKQPDVLKGPWFIIKAKK